MTKKTLDKPPNSLNDKKVVSILARASTGGLIRVAEAAGALKKDSPATALALSRLARKGWVTRIRRGVYFVLPLEATKREGGVASDPWVIAATLYAPCYVGGWSAAEHWELTEQLFHSTFIVTSAHVRSKVETVLGNDYRLVRVTTDRMHGLTTVWRGSTKVMLSDRERTLVDGLANPSWVGGFRHLSDMMATYLSSEHRDDRKLLARADEVAKGAVYKRLGFLIERLDPTAKKIIETLRRKISTGFIKLDPAVAARGTFNATWRVWENVAREQ